MRERRNEALSPISFWLFFCANVCGSSGQLNSAASPKINLWWWSSTQTVIKTLNINRWTIISQPSTGGRAKGANVNIIEMNNSSEMEIHSIRSWVQWKWRSGKEVSRQWCCTSFEWTEVMSSSSQHKNFAFANWNIHWFNYRFHFDDNDIHFQLNVNVAELVNRQMSAWRSSKARSECLQEM